MNSTTERNAPFASGDCHGRTDIAVASAAMCSASASSDSASNWRLEEIIREWSPRLSDRTATRLAKTYLAVEFAAFYIGIPLVIFFDVFPWLNPFVLMWTTAFGVAAWLWWGAADFDRGEFTRFRPFIERNALLRLFVPFSLLAISLTIVVLLTTPESLFRFPKEKPLVWALVMIAYPLLSVLPQTVVFRAFLLYRYRTLFGNGNLLWICGAMAFGFVHIIFRNPIAIGLTAIGGLLFTATYLRTRSIWFSAFEHALYGCWIFTVGWGMYLFYDGNTASESAASSGDAHYGMVVDAEEDSDERSLHTSIIPGS